jgi:hypothetical protein
VHSADGRVVHPRSRLAFFSDAVDFNHDGLDDIAEGNWQYGLQIFLNTGGAFTLD